MNQIAVYDPVVVDQAHAAYEERLFDAVNQNHDRAVQRNAVLAVAALSQQQLATIKAHHSQREAKLAAELRAEKKRARNKARWGNIGKEALMMACCYGFLKAMQTGMIHLNVALPLAVVCLVYGAWLARAIWDELCRSWKEWR